MLPCGKLAIQVTCRCVGRVLQDVCGSPQHDSGAEGEANCHPPLTVRGPSQTHMEPRGGGGGHLAPHEDQRRVQVGDGGACVEGEGGVVSQGQGAVVKLQPGEAGQRLVLLCACAGEWGEGGDKRAGTGRLLLSSLAGPRSYGCCSASNTTYEGVRVPLARLRTVRGGS